MGEFTPPKYAYMVYTNETGMVPGDYAKPTIPSIYKVRATQVAAFRKEFDVAGAVWVPVYAMHDWTDSIIVKDMEIENADTQQE